MADAMASTAHAGELNEGDFWIFGYGSLIWKQQFPFDKCVHGCIKGWKRRFYQGSTDHRGVPGNPGRVVTLLPDHLHRSEEEAEQQKHVATLADKQQARTHTEGTVVVTWGKAFLVRAHNREEVLAYLDYREKGGYEQRYIDVYAQHTDTEPCIRGALVYIGTSENPEYLGYAPLDALAAQIARSVGPSGHNSEYLFNLAHALRDMGVQDEHVFTLAGRVRQVQQQLQQIAHA